MAYQYTLEQLTKPLTTDEVRTSIYSVLARLGVETTNWRAGAVARAIITACAIVIASLSTLIALLTQSGFAALATGTWLKLTAYYVFGVTASEGTFASGVVRFTNAGGGQFGPYAVGEVVVSSSTTGKNYYNAEVFSLNGGATVDVVCTAYELGSAATALAGDIDSLVSALDGVSVFNPGALVGVDAEDDAAIKAKCDAKTGSLSPNGPRDAYNYFARDAKRADGTSIGVTRTRVIPDGLGGVDLYIAGASGAIAGTQDDISTDLGVVHDHVQRNVVPLCITERTHAAPNYPIAVTYELWCDNTLGWSDSKVTTAVNARIASFLSARPIGGDYVASIGAVYRSALDGAIASARNDLGVSLGVWRVILTAPAADVVLAINQAPVAGTITGIVHQQTPGAL